MLGETISHYRILEKLGQGGMGEVYRARDTHLDRDVAIKVLRPQLLEDPRLRNRFRREALSLSRLNHPNIATIHDFDSEGDVDFLVMEFIEGMDLGSMIAERRSNDTVIDEAECIRVGDAIAAALDEAHQHGVIHRDLKPQNVMLTANGQVKVLDFGLAKLTEPKFEDPDAPTATITQIGTVAGTLPYMAPEQVQGLPADARADVYAWGATMYELLTGARPFGEAHGSELVAAIVRDDPPSTRERQSDVAPWLDRIIAKALSKDPSTRQQSARELRAELAQESSASRAASHGSVRRRSKVGKLALGVPALLLLGLASWWLFSSSRLHPTREPSIAILPFDNVAESGDPDRLGEIVGSLLSTSLAESQALTVISRERLLELLRATGTETLSSVDRSTAMDAARRAGSETILTGEILQVAPRYVVTSQLLSLANGRILSTQRVDGEAAQDLFAIVDELSNEIRSDLGAEVSAGSAPQRPVSEISTTSLEAQRHYLDGLRFHSLNYITKSQQSFRRAIEADSTFAMAYLYLGRIDEAVRHIDRAASKDQRLIRVVDLRRQGKIEAAVEEIESLISDYPQEKDYYRQLFLIYFAGATGTPHDPHIDARKALDVIEKAVELDPLDGRGLHLKFYAQFQLGDWENSLRTLDAFTALGEANAYDDLGDFYAWSGRFQEAAEPFRTALKMNLTYTTLVKAGFLHLKLREYDQVREYWRQLASHEGSYERTFGKRLLLILPMYQGRLNEALEQTDAAVSSAELVGENGPEYRRMLVFRSQILGESGHWDAALADCERAVASLAQNSHDEIGWNYYMNTLLRTLAASGDLAGADALIEKYETVPDRGEQYTIALAQVELARGDAEAAYTLLKPLAPASAEMFRAQFTLDKDVGDPFLLGLACLESGRLSEAVEQFENLDLLYYFRVGHQPIDDVRAHYYLGMAFEQSGWVAEAAEEYRKFLEIWEDADPGLRGVEDARARLASIQG